MKKYLVIAIAAGIAYFAYGRFSASDKPTPGVVEPLLANYLAVGKGSCRVSHLADISIGDFSRQFGGWPVYAAHEETCQDGNTSSTYLGLDDAKKQVAAAYARRNAAGDIELFVPQFFQDAQQQLQGALDSAPAK